jgi:excisionase family DNA binding protein
MTMKHPHIPQEDLCLYTPKQCAEGLRVSVKTVRRLIAAGKIETVRRSLRGIGITHREFKRITTGGIDAPRADR